MVLACGTLGYFTLSDRIDNYFHPEAKSPQAYAVFSSDDDSLRIYNNEDYRKVVSLQKSGGDYRDLKVDDVYPIALEGTAFSELSSDIETYNPYMDLSVDTQAIGSVQDTATVEVSKTEQKEVLIE